MNSWLLWGARLFGWAPTMTRAQRHGDLIAMSDLMQQERRTR